jgi:hypothetical protein
MSEDRICKEDFARHTYCYERAWAGCAMFRRPANVEELGFSPVKVLSDDFDRLSGFTFSKSDFFEIPDVCL